jgi:hypothetical protein
VDPPDIAANRTAFLRWMKRVDPGRLVFIDESGAHLAMGRSHAWVLRGEEYVEPRPTNWGDNLSLIGAVRADGWVTSGTQWEAVKVKDFTAWSVTGSTPRLQQGDSVLLDNPRAHKAPAAALIRRRGGHGEVPAAVFARLQPDRGRVGLVNKFIRTVAPRTTAALRRTARAARYVMDADRIAASIATCCEGKHNATFGRL